MYALINHGFVVNVIIAEPSFITEFIHEYDHVIACSSDVGVGYTWNDIDGFKAPINLDPTTTPAQGA